MDDLPASTWRLTRLGEVAEVVGGVALGRNLPRGGTIELPYLRVANVRDGHIDISDLKTVRVLHSEIPRYNLSEGDFLITEGGDFDKLGRGAVWNGAISPCLHQNHIFRIRTSKALLLPRFLAAYAGSQAGRAYFLAASKRTTNLASINLTQVKRFPIPVPPLREQRRIVEILDLVDESIRTTDRLIAKLDEVKNGTLAALLGPGEECLSARDSTRSVPPVTADSTASDWRPCELGDAVNPARPIVYGILMPGRDCPNGIPVVKVRDILDGAIRTSGLLRTNPSIERNYKRSRLLPGDLLFTIRGTVGRRAFVSPHLSGANITQDTARIHLTGANPRFVWHWLDMPTPRAFIALHTNGQAVKGINLRDVRRIPLALPSRDAQERIVAILDAHDARAKSELSKQFALIALKHGLVEDLLTGRVRVDGGEGAGE